MPKTSKTPTKKRQKTQPPKEQESSIPHVIKETSTSVAAAEPSLILSEPQTTSNSTLLTSTHESATSSAEEIIRRNWQTNQGSNRAVAKGYILCESCQIEVREDDLSRHKQGIAHLMAQESPIKPLDTLTLGHVSHGRQKLQKLPSPQLGRQFSNIIAGLNRKTKGSRCLSTVVGIMRRDLVPRDRAPDTPLQPGSNTIDWL